MERDMPKRKYIVVGIGGATNSGKTSVCECLKTELSAEVFNCDKYFHPEDSPKHTPLPEYNGHANWEILSSMDIDALRSDVQKWIEKHSVASDNNNSCNGDTSRVSVLLVEGILVLNHPPLEKLFDLKYYFTVTKEQCAARRVHRHYEPPDPEGYFEGVVWPEHLRYKQELLERADITFVPSDRDLDSMFHQVLHDVRLLL